MSANLVNSLVASGLEKGQFSFQFQRSTVPKNVKTTTQLHSFYMLEDNAQNPSSQASTVHELENFQMYKLDLEKAEEEEIKLLTSAGSQ